MPREYWSPTTAEELKRIRKLSEKEKAEVLGLGKKESPQSPEGIVSPERASEIMGEKSFFGKEQVERAFGFPVPPEKIPPITFSESELIKAKELDQFLVLDIEEINGEKVTPELIKNLLYKKVQDKVGGKFLYSQVSADSPDLKDDSWYKNENFLKDLHLKTKWRLTTKTILGKGIEGDSYDSTSKTDVEQTQITIKYLREQIYQNQSLPKEYQEAIDEFYQYCESEKLLNPGTRNLVSHQEIKTVIGNSDSSKGKIWQDFSKELSQLKINQLTRRDPAQSLCDIALLAIINGERILETTYDRSATLLGDSNLVNVGRFDPEGAFVSRLTPDGSNDALGVSFSRTSGSLSTE